MSEGLTGDISLSDAEIDARVTAYVGVSDLEARSKRMWQRAKSVIE